VVLAAHSPFHMCHACAIFLSERMGAKGDTPFSPKSSSILFGDHESPIPAITKDLIKSLRRVGYNLSCSCHYTLRHSFGIYR